MCPQNVALHHPAAVSLLKYATGGGCPVESGKLWTKQQMTAAVERGPHMSALDPAAIEAHLVDVKEKVANKQCHDVLCLVERHQGQASKATKNFSTGDGTAQILRFLSYPRLVLCSQAQRW